jgi:hypothetical protein
MLQIDRIEADIQGINPGIKYVDLETDRGRFYGYKTPAMKMSGAPQSEPANGHQSASYDS